MKSPTWTVLLIFSSLVPSACFADLNGAYQAIAYDALRARDTVLAKEGYTLSNPSIDSIKVDNGWGTTFAGWTFSSAIRGNLNQYFTFQTMVRKDGKDYTLSCRGYVSGGPLNPGTRLTEIIENKGEKNRQFGSDCTVEDRHWYHNFTKDLPDGEKGKGHVSFEFAPGSYDKQLTASVNRPEPLTLEARSVSERPNKGPLGDPNAADAPGFAPAKSSTEQAL